MRNTLLLVLVALVAGLIGYWIGSDEMPFESDEDNSQFLIIKLDEARALNTEFEKFRKDSSLAQVVNLVSNPINIPDAKADFRKIFRQHRVSGLRAYPGVGVNAKGEKEFTLVFIGTDKNGENVYTQKKGEHGALEDAAKIQDNNNPCKPCTKVL